MKKKSLEVLLLVLAAGCGIAGCGVGADHSYTQAETREEANRSERELEEEGRKEDSESRTSDGEGTADDEETMDSEAERLFAEFTMEKFKEESREIAYRDLLRYEEENRESKIHFYAVFMKKMGMGSFYAMQARTSLI